VGVIWLLRVIFYDTGLRGVLYTGMESLFPAASNGSVGSGQDGDGTGAVDWPYAVEITQVAGVPTCYDHQGNEIGSLWRGMRIRIVGVVIATLVLMGREMVSWNGFRQVPGVLFGYICCNWDG